MSNNLSAEAAVKYADGLWPLVTWLVGQLLNVDPTSLGRMMERPDHRALGGNGSCGIPPFLPTVNTCTLTYLRRSLRRIGADHGGSRRRHLL